MRIPTEREYREAAIKANELLRRIPAHHPEAQAARADLDALRTERLHAERTVFVPREGSGIEQVIARGSGIVGEPQPDGKVKIHYEGNLFGAENMQRFADRVSHAADRQATSYPTTAFAVVDPEDLVPVGTWNGREGAVDVDDEEALARWMGTDSVPETERVSIRGEEIRRLRSAWSQAGHDPHLRRWLQQEAERHGIALPR